MRAAARARADRGADGKAHRIRLTPNFLLLLKKADAGSREKTIPSSVSIPVRRGL